MADGEGMTPQRIQLSRAKGWRMPPNTRKVDRSTRWGNPFNDTQVGVVFFHWGCSSEHPAPIIHLGTEPSRERCIDMFVAYLLGRIDATPDFLKPLRGKNLACWCKPGERCHADVLLRLANA